MAEWRATRDTVHMWTQIVGKTRLALTPRLNHWWNSTLYVSARGEFVLPYAAVRTAADPDKHLREFLDSTFLAAREHADWPTAMRA